LQNKSNIVARNLSTPAVFGEEFLREHPNVSAILDALGPPAVPDRSERIEVDEELANLLELEPIEGMPPLEHRIRVHRVFPCPDCQKPIVEIRFDHNGQHRVCDAVQRKLDVVWLANIITEHDCEGLL
jgi:hypothetical protein